ncbi:hypothetical protein [Kitasatospora sp. NPDC098663]|uniref:hypothetical protein n=1 Tax=Kitasatospora sp. NPDC098663 TaxID=3364096 RepID=UPI0037F38A2B
MDYVDRLAAQLSETVLDPLLVRLVDAVLDSPGGAQVLASLDRIAAAEGPQGSCRPPDPARRPPLSSRSDPLSARAPQALLENPKRNPKEHPKEDPERDSKEDPKRDLDQQED